MTSSRGGDGVDGEPETPAVAAHATENEQVRNALEICADRGACLDKL